MSPGGQTKYELEALEYCEVLWSVWAKWNRPKHVHCHGTYGYELVGGNVINWLSFRKGCVTSDCCNYKRCLILSFEWHNSSWLKTREYIGQNKWKSKNKTSQTCRLWHITKCFWAIGSWARHSGHTVICSSWNAN